MGHADPSQLLERAVDVPDPDPFPRVVRGPADRVLYDLLLRRQVLVLV